MAGPEDAESRRREWRREYNRRWRAEHPEQHRASQKRWVDTHLEEKRAASREYARQRRAERLEREQAGERAEARKEAKRRYAREWYAANKPLHQESQRRYRERQRAENPDEYRARLRATNQRWRDTHREHVKQHQRDKDRDAPHLKRESAARYYAAHGEEIKQRKRDKYWADHEASLAAQRQYRARESWRRSNGLPAQRVRRSSGTKRKANLSAANAFFARPRTEEEVSRLREERGTPRYLIEQFERDSARERAAAYYAEALVRPRRLSETRVPQTARMNIDARAEEDARMDAIASAINDRLRTQPKARASVQPSGTTLTPAPPPRQERSR